MAIDVKVPSVGESITTGVLGEWHKKAGDYVKSGELLVEIETDKVTFELNADVAGVLKPLAETGATVEVGQVIATIDEKAEEKVEKKTSPEKKPSAQEKEIEEKPVSTPSTFGREEAKILAPSARYLAAEVGLKPETLHGTGKGGRILKEDVLRAIDEQKTDKKVTAPIVSSQAANGAIKTSRTTRKPMSPLRQKIAERLVSAQQEAAILTTFNEVDMSNIMNLRQRYQDRFVARHGVKLGFMSFFVKAVVHALQEVPQINAQIDDNEIVQNHFYDIGVAISTERGLFVPVIRDADQLSFAQIEQAIIDYSQKAKSGKITLPDLEGGVFTITNGGVFGSLLSTPILNPPQSGILGMHTIQERPVAVNGHVEIRPMMYLALSYDHRLVDGKEAVTFLVKIKEFVENPVVALMQL
ncbi:MAG: 2-oxoglutarate dehydrogenase complex dihydrolipoyllysine-residue succinyltransferase [Verrucomicrobiia bacterium]